MKGKLSLVQTKGRKFILFSVGRYGIELILNLLPGRFGFCIYYAWPNLPGDEP